MTTLILSVFFSISASAYDVEVDGIYYNLVSKAKIAEVTEGDGKYSGSINIPSIFTSYANAEVENTTLRINEIKNKVNLFIVPSRHIFQPQGRVLAYCYN